MMRLAIFSVFLTAAAAWAAAPEVAILGTYQKEYQENYRRAGCVPVSLSESELMADGNLARFAMIHLAHWRPIPEAAQRKLVAYVENGGTCLYSFGSLPAEAFFGGFLPPTAEGKAFEIGIVNTARDFFSGVRERIEYPNWGFTIDLPQSLPNGSILAYWEPPVTDQARADVAPSFHTRRPAIFRLAYGKGQVFYSGAHLSYTAGAPLLESIINRVMPETNPTLDFTTPLRAAVPVRENCEGIGGETVAVFREPGFPVNGLPADVTPEFVLETLTAAGIRAEFVSVADLVRGLEPERFNTLILTAGESFPADAYLPLKRYLGAGGGLVSPAGVPLSRPRKLADGIWREMVGEDFRNKFIYAMCKDLLPIAKFQPIAYGAEQLVQLNDTFLPGLPILWPGTGGYAFQLLPGQGFRPFAPLLGMSNAAGEVLALPLVFDPLNPKYPAARFVFLGIAGDRHPWSPGSWKFAREALTAMTRLALRRDWRTLPDFYADQPLYEPGETAILRGTVSSRIAQPAELKLAVYAKESDAVLLTRICSLKLTSGDTPFEISLTLPDVVTESFDVIATLDDGGSPVRPQRALLPVRRSEAEFSGPDFGFADGAASLDGRPAILSGVNFYSNENRSLGFFLGGEENPRRLPDIWERDLSLIRLAGGNSTRSHYMEHQLSPETFAAPVSAADRFAQRTLDCARLLHARFGMALLLNPVTFVPNLGESWAKWNLGDGNPYTEPRHLDATAAYYSGLADWCRTSRNIVWEVINEPEAVRARTAGTPDRAIHDWVARMARILRKSNGNVPVGIGNAGPENSFAWNIRENLNGVVDWGHVHPYYEDLLTLDGYNNIAYAMNFSRPALMGEVGLPNAMNSNNAILGDWGAFYENLFALATAEQSVGFQNFYLSYAMWNDSPEWGMLLPEQVERESFKRWKLWNFVNETLNPAAVSPPGDRLIYHSADRRSPRNHSVLRRGYLTLVNHGVRNWIMSESDPVGTGIVRAWILYSPETEIWARDYAATLKKQNVQAVPLAYEQAEAMLKKIAPAPGAVALPHTQFDYSYALPRVDGGTLIVLARASGVPVTFSVGQHRYDIAPRAGSAVVIDTDFAGAPRLIQLQGTLKLDGQLFFAVGGKAPAALCVHNGLLHADDPGLVEVGAKLAKPVAPGSSFRLAGAPLAAESVERFAQALQANSHQLARSGEADYTVEIRLGGSVSRGGVWPEVRDGSAVRWYEPWSGMIRADGAKIVITAVDESAAVLALLRLSRMKQLGDFSVGPFGWLGGNKQLKAVEK